MIDFEIVACTGDALICGIMGCVTMSGETNLLLEGRDSLEDGLPP